ncbi:ubiquitin fusion degradation protein [Thoreauomyces humboldtii]|nr:ubiquitin fusion degradation protein [Thoreauomyces humboldtii]
MWGGSYYDEDQGHHLAGVSHFSTTPFSETYRCYSAAMLPSRTERPELLYGGKIVLPNSAFMKLSALHIVYPMLFSLTSNAQESPKVTHSGVLEFTAEEGRVYVPQWMMKGLGLQEGSFVKVKNTELSLGTFVKIQPQSVDFLQITDPKAVLEQAFRNFSTLTVGDIITFRYNDTLYDILVLEVKPMTDAQGISIVETDLEVDFAPPLGYVEPEPVYRPKTHGNTAGGGGGVGGGAPSVEGSRASIAQHTVAEEIGFKPFGGSGQKLSGKTDGTGGGEGASTAKGKENDGPVPAALRLPPGKLFFGYPVIPVKGKGEDAEGSDGKKGPTFSGQGQTLKAARKSNAGQSPSTSAPGVSPSGSGSK